MYFCTDCHLPASLDDAVTIFRDGTCICLACHRRDQPKAVPEDVRRAVEALLAALDAA
ncbi:MAG TPA: cytochrome c3 family protein [Dehalococcoidia bacterium]|nr:cytochrome c3 family protein [Dehalococcoidia bacterium]